MKYYATAPDKVSKIAEESSIEITKEQYKEAIDVLCNPFDHRVISTEGGVLSFVAVEAPKKPERPQPSREESLMHMTSQYIDKVANEIGYMGELNVLSYLTSTNPKWAAEAAAFRDWRDTVWAYTYAFEGDLEDFDPPKL